MELLFGITFFILVVFVSLLVGVIAIMLYAEIRDDLIDIYEDWKNKKK